MCRQETDSTQTMNGHPRLLMLVMGLVVSLARPASAQWLTQEVPLRAGWNAVYLHVQPYPSSCDTQFAGTPVLEVHRYNQRVRVAQFDTDPSKPFRRPAEWLTWRPDDGTNRFVRTLDALVGDMSYLVHAASPVTLQVRGRPMIPRREWVPGIPNLAGFQIDPTAGAQPTFAAYFAAEPRIPVVGGPEESRLQEVDANLNGIDLTSRSRRLTMAPGRAYWIRPGAHSRYVGPMQVRTVNPEGLFFDTAINEIPFHIVNTSGATLELKVEHVPSEAPPAGMPPKAGEVPLLWAELGTRTPTRQAWPVGGIQTRSLAPGEEWGLRVAVDRQAMNSGGGGADASATWQSLLRIRGGGMQVHVPVGARNELTVAARSSGADPQSGAYPAGLWVGDANISLVSYAGTNDLDAEAHSTAKPVSQAFPLRLIVHRDSAGVCRLLSQVLVVGKTVETAASTNVVISLQADGGNNVTPSLGSAQTLGRITSPAFGAIGSVPVTNASGVFLKTPVLWTFQVAADHPLNPFRHLYHPQHTQGIALKHSVEMHWFNPDTATNPPAALWNPDQTISGLLVQTVEGLTHVPIRMQGQFTLKRVSTVATLTDSP